MSPPRRDTAAAGAGAEGPTCPDEPWLAGYPAGVPTTVPSEPAPLTRLLDDATTRFPDAVALTHGGAPTTYRQLSALVDRCAAALAARGVGTGRAVSIVLANCPELVVALLATARLGGTAVLHRPGLPPAVLARELQQVRPTVVVAPGAIGRGAPELLGAAVAVLATTPSPADHSVRGWGNRLRAARQARRPGVPLPDAALTSWQQALNMVDGLPVRRAVDPAHPAVVLWTGGAEGAPAAVAHTHAGRVDAPVPGAMGLPLPSVRCRVMSLDDEPRPVPAGCQGELWVAGPQAAMGYPFDTDRTDAVVGHDGWVRTGDVVVMDDDGLFRHVARRSELAEAADDGPTDGPAPHREVAPAVAGATDSQDLKPVVAHEPEPEREPAVDPKIAPVLEPEAAPGGAAVSPEEVSDAQLAGRSATRRPRTVLASPAAGGRVTMPADGAVFTDGPVATGRPGTGNGAGGPGRPGRARTRVSPPLRGTVVRPSARPVSSRAGSVATESALPSPSDQADQPGRPAEPDTA